MSEQHTPKAIWDPDIAGLAIEISNQYVIWTWKSEQGEKTFEDTKLRTIRAMISQYTTTEVARLEAEKAELVEASRSCIKEFEHIDKHTPHSETEPEWWLAWSNVCRKTRAALAKARPDES